MSRREHGEPPDRTEGETLAAITAASDRTFAAIMARFPAPEHAQVLAALDALIAASEA